MDILVLVKQVPGDLTSVTMTPSWTVDRGSGSCVTNAVDRNALEAAVRIVEEIGGTVTCLTLGPASAAAVLKECVSVGATAGVHVSDEAFAGSDALGTARILAAAVSAIGPVDLVLAGARSFDGGTAVVPGMLAELLDLPQVTAVTGLELADGALVADQVVEGGRARVQVNPPALISVDEYINTPRYPTVKSKLAANKARFRLLSNAELGLGAAGLGAAAAKVVSAGPPPSRGTGVRIEGDTPQEIADRLCAALVDANLV